MNADQQQLLQLLKIQPYQLHVDFSAFALPSLTATALSSTAITEPVADVAQQQPQVTAEVTEQPATDMPPAAKPQLAHNAQLQQLTADILRQLQAWYPTAHWQASAQFQRCQWQGDLLQTPEIEALCSAYYKKQLWLQFIQPQEIPDVSDHSSSHTN